MRIGLLADIHGNSAALAATLEGAAREGVERILCAGDCVGYYYDPGTCLDLLAEWDVECVRGNHEDLLAGLVREPSIADDLHRRYGSALAQAASSLSPRHLAYLAGLPVRKEVTIGGRRILLCHGSPWDPDSDVKIPDTVPGASLRTGARSRGRMSWSWATRTTG